MVVIPARNEATRIAACLEALLPQAVAADCGLLVVVNSTTDHTAVIARRLLEDRQRVRCCVLDLAGEVLPGGVGQARALGFSHALRENAGGALLSTDADCVVAPSWLEHHLAELAEVDIVFGRILPVADELALLGPRLHRNAAIENAYMTTAVNLAARLDPLAHDPNPGHRTAAGANFALRPSVLDVIGSFPALATKEDRAFARAAEQHDLRIRYCAQAQVHASCRLDGRAAGGMADTLRARCAQEDPFCDDWLEPARTFTLRHGLRGRLRRAWPDPARLAGVLSAYGLLQHPMPAETTSTFGAFWFALETAVPELAPRPLRHSEALRELPRLRAFLAKVEAGAALSAFAGCGNPELDERSVA